MSPVSGILCLLLRCTVQPVIPAIVLKNTVLGDGGFFVQVRLATVLKTFYMKRYGELL